MKFVLIFVCAFGLLKGLPIDNRVDVNGKSETEEKFNGQTVYHENGLGAGIDWSNYVPNHMLGKAFPTRQERSADEQKEQMNGQVEYHENGLGQGIDWSQYAPMHMLGKSFGQKQKRSAESQQEHVMNGQVEYHENGLGQGIDWSQYAPMHMLGKSFGQKQKRSADTQQVQMNGQVEYHENGLGQDIDWSQYAPMHMLGKSFEQRQKRTADSQQEQMNGQVEYHENGLGQDIDWSQYAPMHMLGKSFGQKQKRSAEEQREHVMNGQVEYHENGLGQGIDWSNYAPMHMLGKSFEQRQKRSADGSFPQDSFPFFHQQASGQAAMPLPDSFYYPGTASRPVNLPLNWSPEMNNRVQNRVARDVFYMNGSLVPTYFPQQQPQYIGGQFPMPNQPWSFNNFYQQYQYYQRTPGYFVNQLPVAPIQRQIPQDWSSYVPAHKLNPELRQSAEQMTTQTPTKIEYNEILQISDDFPNKGSKPTYKRLQFKHMQKTPLHQKDSAYTQFKLNQEIAQSQVNQPIHMSETADSYQPTPINVPQFNGQYKFEAAKDIPTQQIDWSQYVPMHRLNKPIVANQPSVNANIPSLNIQPTADLTQATSQYGAIESKDILGQNMDNDFVQHEQFGGQPKVQRSQGFEQMSDAPIWSN